MIQMLHSPIIKSFNHKLKLPQNRLQYFCFLTYDAESLARKLSNAYPVRWEKIELETKKILPTNGGSSSIFQIYISEGVQQNMILITPYDGNNIFSDHLDIFGEGFHHTCFIYNKLDEYKIQQEYLLKSGYSRLQLCSFQSIFESCVLKHPDVEFPLELLYIIK